MAAPCVERSEWVLVGLLVLIGIMLRCWLPSHMAVEHFDEGVYASNVFFPDGQYPFRHLYAPPLLPALLEWAFILSGRAAGSVMWVNVVAGCLMVPSVWWVGRQWFGPTAGVTAAALAAFSEVHILYSRTALTDVLLCLWMLWGVYWAWRAISEGSPAAILLAGIFASLAWWTKYNGWLTLAISGSGTIAWLMAERWLRPSRFAAPLPSAANQQERTANRSVPAMLRWAMIATLAVVSWLPYIVELQQQGGYATVAANHARYFVGLSGWWDGLLRQMANLAFIETRWTVAGLFWAVGMAFLMIRLRGYVPSEPGKGALRSWRVVLTLSTALIAGGLLAWLGGLTSVLAATALGGLGGFLLHSSVSRETVPGSASPRPQPTTKDSPCDFAMEERTTLAAWMLAAWLIGLFVAVPLYHPYPRLTLPFVVACWLGSGLALSQLRPAWIGLRPHTDRQAERSSRRRHIGWGVGLAVLSIVLLAGRARFDETPPAWEDRRSLQTIATEIMERLPADGNQILAVVGEPGLFYQLAAKPDSPQRLVVPWADVAELSPSEVATATAEIFAVVGTHSNGPLPENTRLVAEWPYRRSRLVLLNQYAPSTIETGDLEPATIQLLRFTHPGERGTSVPR